MILELPVPEFILMKGQECSFIMLRLQIIQLKMSGIMIKNIINTGGITKTLPARIMTMKQT